MSPPDDALEAGLRIARVFDQHDVPYALGGALAYGQYGIPRATHDVDVNIFLDADHLEPLFEALSELGIESPADGVTQARRDGLIVAHWGSMRIDLFTPSIPFSDEALRTRKRFTFDDQNVWFLSAEALSVFKLLFFRGKDVSDLERLVAVMGDAIDHAYVRKHIAEMMGDDDPRTALWDKIVAELSPR
jgi:hypothetical protein